MLGRVDLWTWFVCCFSTLICPCPLNYPVTYTRIYLVRLDALNSLSTIKLKIISSRNVKCKHCVKWKHYVHDWDDEIFLSAMMGDFSHFTQWMQSESVFLLLSGMVANDPGIISQVGDHKVCSSWHSSNC